VIAPQHAHRSRPGGQHRSHQDVFPRFSLRGVKLDRTVGRHRIGRGEHLRVFHRGHIVKFARHQQSPRRPHHQQPTLMVVAPASHFCDD
jgi:hypothetical protein